MSFVVGDTIYRKFLSPGFTPTIDSMEVKAMWIDRFGILYHGELGYIHSTNAYGTKEEAKAALEVQFEEQASARAMSLTQSVKAGRALLEKL